jgi:hypothetical protein
MPRVSRAVNSAGFNIGFDYMPTSRGRAIGAQTANAYVCLPGVVVTSRDVRRLDVYRFTMP